MTSTRWARFTRGWLLAAFSVLVAALSHSFAGGVTPGWLSVVLALAFASMLSIGLSGPRGSKAAARAAAPAAITPHAATPPLWRTVLAAGGSQILFHGLFSLLGATPVSSVAGGAGTAPAAATGHSGHLLSSAEIASQLASANALSGTAFATPSLVPAGAHHDVWMLLAHTLAGLLTIAVILRGEQAVRSLARTAGLALRALVVRPISIIVIPDAAPARLTANTVWVPRPLDVVHASLRHRGPPLRSQLAQA